MPAETPEPADGQIWQDTDPRSSGRKVRIVEIGETHATVHDGKRQSRIRLDRFRPTSTGYRYIGSGN
ncbi:hypothetical protein ACFYO9_37495 [Streptomyces sp. NPDC005863]|uniref:hypothetical protein n=1 Tax=Streptomyces sp. NPDC005863 TaxID=3364735 RepID=UPI003689EA2B